MIRVGTPSDFIASMLPDILAGMRIAMGAAWLTIVAAELANYVLSPAHPPEQATVCASGFRATTRIASGSPEMWRDIALANRQNLSLALEAFTAGFQPFGRFLDSRITT